MVTRACAQVVTFACMNFAFWECDENEVDAILTCVIHKDSKHNSIAFILDMMTKNNKIDREHDADQPPSYSVTSGHHVAIGHFLTEDKFIASKKYITLKKRCSQLMEEYQKQI